MNLVKYLHSDVMRIFAIKKIEAKILGANWVPKACCSQRIVWIHFVLNASFIIINLFQIIYDSYISLNWGLLLSRCYSLSSFSSFLPFFLFIAFSFVQHPRISFRTTFPLWTSWTASAFSYLDFWIRLLFWEFTFYLFLVKWRII